MHPAQGAAPGSRNVILRGNFLTFPTLIGKTKPDPCCTARLGQGQLVNTNANEGTCKRIKALADWEHLLTDHGLGVYYGATLRADLDKTDCAPAKTDAFV